MKEVDERVGGFLLGKAQKPIVIVDSHCYITQSGQIETTSGKVGFSFHYFAPWSSLNSEALIVLASEQSPKSFVHLLSHLSLMYIIVEINESK